MTFNMYLNNNSKDVLLSASVRGKIEGTILTVPVPTDKFFGVINTDEFVFKERNHKIMCDFFKNDKFITSIVVGPRKSILTRRFFNQEIFLNNKDIVKIDFDTRHQLNVIDFRKKKF